ncbi:RNA polymerase sigma factor [Spirillospora sp. NPDC049024]
MTADPEYVAALVRGAQRGDSMAMQALLDLLAPYVGRLCGPIALEDGPDAAQETLIAVFRGISRLREPAALFGWVRAIAIREAVRTARRAGPPAEPLDLDAVPQTGDLQEATDVRDLLDRLSPEHRAVLVLRDIEGLDERTVGKLLQISTGTVKSRLHRARKSFRKAWQG